MTGLRQIISIGVGVFILGAITGAGPDHSSRFLIRYQQFSNDIRPINRTLPLRIHSEEHERRLHVDVYGIVSQPYERVANALTYPKAMCDFLILNLNVKACTYEPAGRYTLMTFYVAGKKYTPLYRSMEIEPYFEQHIKSNHYMRVVLASRKRRWGAKDYSVLIEAAPYRKSTLVRFSSNYTASRLNTAATATYLKTLARKKVGFSIVGQDEHGKPQYVRGMQAVVERNAVRSYLALQAYLETTAVLPGNQFDARLKRWFELTELYSRQLHELSWEDYLRNKRKEHKNQLRIQQQIFRRQSKHDVRR